MATLEEVQAAIAQKQGGDITLDAVRQAIAQKTQQQAPEQQENLSYFDRMKQRNAGAIQAGENLTEKIKASIKGNAEFPDAGSFESWQWTQPNLGFNMANIKTTAAGMFGSDKDKFNSFVKQNPNVKIYMDNAQNPYFEDKGKKYYLDMPGLDAGDIGDFMGEAGLFASAGNVALMGNKANALRRATQMGASQYGADVLAQNLAGKDDVNYGQSAFAGGLGFGVNIASPYAGKVYHWAKNKINGNSRLMKDGAKLAKANNMELDDNELEALGRIRNTLDKSVSDEAIIAEYKHGLKLTRGQATDNIAQKSEEQILSKDPDYINKFKSVEDYNKGQVEQNLRKMRSKMHGQTDDVLDPTVTGESARDALITAEQTAKKAYVNEFKKVKGLAVKPESIDNLGDFVSQGMKKNNVNVHPKNTPKANEALEIIKNKVAKFNPVPESKPYSSSYGQMSSMPKPPREGVSLKSYQSTRKEIDRLYSNNMDETDKRALTIIKNQHDKWFYNSVDDALLSGNKENVDQLLKARGMMTDYSKTFNSKDKVNKVIRNIIKDENTPEEFSNMLVGVNGTNKAGAGNLVKAYKNAVGADSEGWNTLRAHVFEKMMLSNAMKSDGSMAFKGYKGLMNSFGKGKTMMKELYTQKEFAEISSLMRSVGQIVKEEGLANPSGSGFVMARLEALMKRIPFYTSIKNASKYSKSQTMPKHSPQVDMPIPEILGAAQASYQQN